MKRRPPSRDARDPYRGYSSWKDRENEFEARPLWTGFKWGAGIVFAGAALLALIGLLSTGSVFWQGEKAELTNPAREKAIVFDPNRTLSTYEAFYDLCNGFNRDIMNAEDALTEAHRHDKAYDAEADWTGQQRQSIDALHEHARGLRNQARDKAAQYNADSSKNTRAPFKAADLPYTLDPQGEELADCGTPKEAGR